MNGIAIYKISPGQTFPEMPDIRADEPILSFHGKVLFAALFLGAAGNDFLRGEASFPYFPNARKSARGYPMSTGGKPQYH